MSGCTVFSTLSHKRYDFRGKKLTIQCVSIFPTILSQIFVVLRRIQRDMITVFFGPIPPHVLVEFVVLPSGHGRSVTDFWVWDDDEARLRCPDDVSGDIGGCNARGALKPKFYQPTQTMVTAGIHPFRENSHGRAGNRTRDLLISSQIW